MTNPNVIGWIGSVDRLKFKQQSPRPFHQDEQQFYLFHPPMPTENWKQLKEYFDERSKLEKERFNMVEEERKLVDKFDDLNRLLLEVSQKPASTPDDQQKKEEEINSIRTKIQKIAEDLVKLRNNIAEKDGEIDRVNEKINEMTQIVIEDEHKVVQQQQELEKEKNEKKVENLMAQL